MSNPERLSDHFYASQVQRDPYANLLSQQELQAAKNLPLRLVTHSLAIGGTAFYYLSRHNELGRLRAGRVSYDMVFGVGWRVLIAVGVADQVSRHLFCNYVALKHHKIADYELRKAMRRMSAARPMTPFHLKPNSYFWV